MNEPVSVSSSAYQLIRRVHAFFRGRLGTTPRVSAAESDDLARTLTLVNLQRLRTISWIAALYLPVLTFYDFSVLMGTNSSAAWQAWWHSAIVQGIWIVSAVLYLAFFAIPRSPADITHRHRLVEVSFIGLLSIVPAFRAEASVVHQSGMGGYSLIVLAIAVFILMDGHRCFLTFGVSWITALIVLLTVRSPESPIATDLGNCTLSTFFAIVLSRMVYATTVIDFFNQRVIQRQSAELEHANRALARSNDRLRRVSYLDSLTEIPNRRYLVDYLTREWKRAIRDQNEISLLMVDIDLFKEYNDTFGHQAADECLVRVATAFTKRLKRATDLVARYGGDEFVVVLPDTGLSEARQVAEYLRDGIGELSIPHQASLKGHVTISLGVACLAPKVGESFETLIALADESLYVAKSRGRDCCGTSPDADETSLVV